MFNEFWKNKSLCEMNEDEWELICDHCGRCCLIKLQDVDTNKVFYTNVACQLLNPITCLCTAYNKRKKIIKSCLDLSPEVVPDLDWLPDTCAYKRLAHGKDLDWWHPLISGNMNSVVKAGISISGKVISEKDIDLAKLEDYVIDWIEYS
jgi:uncharacterized cysteine cluster protein YcgN (CxxCxxCC family)